MIARCLSAIADYHPSKVCRACVDSHDRYVAGELARAHRHAAASHPAFRAMVEALRPFADLGVGSGPDWQADQYRIHYGAIRKARAALLLATGE